MARETFNDFVAAVIAKAKADGKITDFSKVQSYYFPRYFYSGSWNRLMDVATEMTGTYTPKGAVPFSSTNMYSASRVVRLVDFLHDIQYLSLNGYEIEQILNPTDKVKPFFSQLNAVIKATTVSVTGVAIAPKTNNLAVGATRQLTATVSPDNATNSKVTYKSSDESVATVDANGLVTAKAEGTATITVTTEDGSKTDTATVTVAAA